MTPDLLISGFYDMQGGEEGGGEGGEQMKWDKGIQREWTYINFSFPNFDIFAKVMFFYRFSLHSSNSIPNTFRVVKNRLRLTENSHCKGRSFRSYTKRQRFVPTRQLIHRRPRDESNRKALMRERRKKETYHSGSTPFP
jgi:hypothetical protein